MAWGLPSAPGQPTITRFQVAFGNTSPSSNWLETDSPASWASIPSPVGSGRSATRRSVAPNRRRISYLGCLHRRSTPFDSAHFGALLGIAFHRPGIDQEGQAALGPDDVLFVEPQVREQCPSAARQILVGTREPVLTSRSEKIQEDGILEHPHLMLNSSRDHQDLTRLDGYFFRFLACDSSPDRPLKNTSVLLAIVPVGRHVGPFGEVEPSQGSLFSPNYLAAYVWTDRFNGYVCPADWLHSLTSSRPLVCSRRSQ
jgi:hypothetical protein